jgi:hypothetical protein
MINIYRSKDYDCEINFFHGREWVQRNEVVLKEKFVTHPYEKYVYAEPSTPGNYAFGGTILFTSNGIYPEFNTPIKLHDRRMDLER